MSDETTKEEKEDSGIPVETKEVIKTTETKEVTDAKETKDTEDPMDSSIFVTEDDRFEITIKHYLGDDGKLIVEGVNDDTFDPNKDNVEEFTMTFKYPSQRDYALIKGNSSIENISDIFNLELVRIAVLFRSWTYGNDVAALDNVHPSLSKAIALKVRNVIQYDAIL